MRQPSLRDELISVEPKNCFIRINHPSIHSHQRTRREKPAIGQAKAFRWHDALEYMPDRRVDAECLQNDGCKVRNLFRVSERNRIHQICVSQSSPKPPINSRFLENVVEDGAQGDARSVRPADQLQRRKEVT